MSFDFYTVKILFEQFNIVKNKDRYIIIDVTDNKEYDFYDSNFAEMVKFSYVWAYAANGEFTNPLKFEEITLNKSDFQIYFKEDYITLYEVIMKTVIESMQNDNLMLDEDTLLSKVNKENINLDIPSLIKGLYLSDCYPSFYYWVEAASPYEIVPYHELFTKVKKKTK